MCESWAEGVEISIVRLERRTSHNLAQGAELSHSCSHALQMAVGLCWGSPGPFGNITNTWGLFHTCVELCRCGGLMLMGSTWPHRNCCHEGQHKELGGVVAGFAGGGVCGPGSPIFALAKLILRQGPAYKGKAEVLPEWCVQLGAGSLGSALWRGGMGSCGGFCCFVLPKVWMACSALFSQLYMVIQSNSLGFSVTYKAYHFFFSCFSTVCLLKCPPVSGKTTACFWHWRSVFVLCILVMP